MEKVKWYSSKTIGSRLTILVKTNRFLLVLFIISLQPIDVAGQKDTIAKKDTKYALSIGYGFGSLFFTPNYTISHNLFYDTIDTLSFQTEELTTDLKIKPILAKFSFKINERSSLGIQCIYNGYIASGTNIDSIWVEGSQSYTVNRYRTKFVMNRFRVQLLYIRHFQHKNPRFESSFYTALGWSNKFRKYYENDQEVNSSNSTPFAGGFGTEVNNPISIRLAYNVCINLSDRLGLYTEFGLGGPLLTIGLTTKF